MFYLPVLFREMMRTKKKASNCGVFLLLLFFGIHGSADAETGTNATVTYAEHIAAIIDANCVSCHREGQSAPFSLEVYADVARRAKLIGEVTENHIMPPWYPIRGHQEYTNERGLSVDEITMIKSWIEQGTPEGDISKRPTPPEFNDGWALGEPDLIVQMAEPFTVPAEDIDIYINFVVDLPKEVKGKWLTALEYKAQAPLVAHHTLIDLDYTGLCREFDAAEEGPGFRNMVPWLEDHRIYVWAVGNLPVPYPEGVGFPLTPDTDIILESHFHPVGKELVEQAQIGLYLSDTPPTQHMINVQLPYAFGIATNLDIPAGEKAYTVKESFVIPVDCLAVDVMPHAHNICKEMLLVAEKPDGNKETLIEIKDWNFAWQELYPFKEPIPLPKGTKLHATLVYDNSADNPNNPSNPPKRVIWGPATTDEMASLAVNVIVENPKERDAIQQALWDYRDKTINRIDLDLAYVWMAKMMYEIFDENGDNDLKLGEKIKLLKTMPARIPKPFPHISLKQAFKGLRLFIAL